MSTAIENESASKPAHALLLAAFNASADAFVVVDAQGCVLYINHAAGGLLGWRGSEAIGRRWDEVVQFVAGAPTQHDLGLNDRALHAGSEQSTVRLRDGSMRTVAARIDSIADTTGHQAPSTLITLRSNDPVLALQSALDVSEQRLRVALTGGQVGLWEWQADSDTLQETGVWVGRTAHTASGGRVSGQIMLDHTHPDDVANVREALRAHLRGETEHYEVEQRVRLLNGDYVHLLVRGQFSERDADGRARFIIGTYTDITALKANESFLHIALENGHQGLFDWQPLLDRVEFSHEWYGMLGHPPGSITSHSDNVQRILHPDDVAHGRAALVPMLKGERDDFQVEHRFRHRDGHYLNILSRGRAVARDGDGRATRVIGTHVDVTALKATEAQLRESRQLLETVLDALPVRVFWKDANSRYLGCNRRFAEDVGVTPATSIIGKLDAELPWRDSAAVLRDDDLRILSGSERRLIVERNVVPASGEAIWVETHKVPIHDGAGAIIGVLGIYDDITARHASEQQLRVVANALTSGKQLRLLNAVTRAAAELAGADYAFVARINHDQTATMSAYFPNHEVFRGLTYALAGTPSETAIANGGYFVGHGVAARYPNDPLLQARSIEAYYGQPLATSDGEIIGIFTMMFTSAVTERERVQPVIDIFAARAVTELERERTHAELRASEQRLNAAMEGAHQGLWEWDVNSDDLTIFGSRYGGTDVTGAPPTATGTSMAARIHPEDRVSIGASLRGFLRGEAPHFACEIRYLGNDDIYQWTLVRGRATRWDDAGRVQAMLGTFTDISALKDSQAALERSQQFLELIVDTVPQAIFWQDRDFRYLGCNRHFAELAGVSDPHELLGKTDQDLWWANQATEFTDEDQSLLDGKVERVAHETGLLTPFGEARWVDLIKVPIRDGAGTVIGLLGAIHDISVRKRAEENAQRLSLYDPLTNLPNRRYFAERLDASIAAATRRGSCGALLFIDMDQFKRINDTLGHAVGDALLQAVANRLLNVTRQDDMVARLGGDEFVVVLPELAHEMDQAARQARQVADKIHESLGQPYQFDHHQFHVTPTIGITLFPEAGKGSDDVLKEADTAMYSGKAAGRNVTRFFHPEMEQNAQARLLLESDLRVAIKRDQLRIVFQPQVDKDGRVSAAEVLLRWHHPSRGVILPTEFIPLAEERGLITDIGRWVLEETFATYRRWLDAPSVEVGELAINVSSRQFRADTFLEDVERLLSVYRIPPQRIVFEITESTVMEDVDATIAIMDRLRRLGALFALDDFGVGYSSLSYLKRLPIDQLKIDRSFIADIGTDRNDEIICQTIVAMGQHLGLQTVAEGVETSAQLDFLKGMNCNRFQGYLFLPPSPEQEFLRYCQGSESQVKRSDGHNSAA
jgi:diguanylate cyclase (GGDEF)-like protein/PAS domain S-box-containing protein